MSSEQKSIYTAPFSTPESRIGTWVFPKEINDSSEWMGRSADKFHLLNDKSLEFVWGMRDPAFKHKSIINTWKSYFPDRRWTMINNASHYLQETAFKEIAEAVRRVAS